MQKCKHTVIGSRLMFKLRGNKQHVPDFWGGYQALAKEEYKRSSPIESVRFVVFDTETTGLKFKMDNLLSIGAVAVKGRSILASDNFECFLEHSKGERGKESIPIHGILPLGSELKTTREAALAAWLKYLGTGILVAHHLDFDRKMINRTLVQVGGGRMWNAGLDTIRLAKRVHPEGPYQQTGGYNLDRLLETHGIAPHDRHTAAGDAMLTAILFLKLCARLQQRGARTLGDLLAR